MVSEVITYLNDQIKASSLFEINYGYAKLVRDAEGEKPIYPTGKNEWSNIEYTDADKSFSYIRINGDITKSDSSGIQTTSCDDDTLTYYLPVRIVFFSEKTTIEGCDGFEEFTLSEKLQAAIDMDGVATEISAKSIDLKPKSEIHDSAKLLKQEYDGRQMVPNLDYV